MPPSIFRTPNFSNQLQFSQGVRKSGIPLQFIYLVIHLFISSQEVSLRRSQSSVASTVPELPGLSDKHNLVEDSVDELVQGKCYFFLDLSLSLNVKTTEKCGLLGSCFPGTFDNMCNLILRELNQQSTITLLNTFYRRNISWNQMNWDSATCITYYTDYYQRLTLESWLTNLEKTPQNRSQQLLAPYKRVIDGPKQN